MLPVLPHDRSRRFEPDTNTATLVDIGALGGDAPTTSSAVNNAAIAATLTRRFATDAIMGIKRLSMARCNFSGVIPEIDIWRAATLMLKRYGHQALEQGDLHVDELTAAGDTHPKRPIGLSI